MTNSIAALHAVPTDPSFVDLEAAERAAADLIQALGADTESESLEGTPRRIAAMYAELMSPVPFDATTFPNDGGYDELVVAREIQFHSLCEHHLLPFTGVAHVGYLPRGRIVGLSKLARTLDHFARRPQTQERLTMQVADLLEDQLSPRGVGVLLVAEHTCMTLRGARAPGSATTTSSLRGHLRENAAARAEFLTLVNGGVR